MEGKVMPDQLRALLAKAKPIILMSVMLQALYVAGLAQANQGPERPKQPVAAPAISSSTFGLPTSLYQPLKSAKVAQDKSGAGGGEGKPEDWESPARMRLDATPYPNFPNLYQQNLWPFVFNLLSWWL